MAGARDFPSMDGVEVNERPMAPTEEADFGVPPRNPNVGQPGDIGTQYRGANFGNQGPMPGATAATEAAGEAGSMGSINGVRGALGRIADTVGRAGSAAPGALAKGAGLAGVGLGTYGAVKDAQAGDYGGAAMHGGDAVASGMLATGIGTLPAAGYLAARAGASYGEQHMPQQMKDDLGDTLGKAIDTVVPTWMGGASPSARNAFDQIEGAQNRGRNIVTGSGYIPKPLPGAAAAPASGPAVADGGPNPTDARLANGMQVPGGQSASDVKFGNQQGAAVAGADGVRKFVDGSGRTMYSNVPGDNSEIMAGSKALGIAPGIAPGTGTGGTGGAPAAMDPNTLSTSTGNGPGLGIIGGPNYVSPEQEMAQKFNAQVADENAAKNLSPRQAAQFAAERRGQDMTLAGTRMNNETSRANAQSTNNVSMRGQDLSHDAQMFGHQITGANARARLGYEMGKDRRDFGLRAAQFDQKQNEDNFEQQGKREEQIQKNLESRFTTTDGKGDVVPDRAKIGEYQTAVNATLPAMIKELTDAGTPAALAKAADIRKRGPAALEPGDHDELQQLFDTRNRMIQSRGIGPNAGTAVQSPNLFDYRQLPGAAGVEHRTFGGNRIVTKAGSVSSNDLRYADGPANSILPDSPWKQQTTNLTRGLRTE